jgi:hypothetical protein
MFYLWGREDKNEKISAVLQCTKMRNTAHRGHTAYRLDGKQDAATLMQYASLENLNIRGESANSYIKYTFTQDCVMNFVSLDVYRRFHAPLCLILLINYFETWREGYFRKDEAQIFLAVSSTSGVWECSLWLESVMMRVSNLPVLRKAYTADWRERRAPASFERSYL